MRKNALTSPKYQTIYDFIVSFKANHDGNSPTIRQIGEDCGVSSTSMVSRYLDGMVKLGLIKRIGKFRMLSIPGARWIAPAK